MNRYRPKLGFWATMRNGRWAAVLPPDPEPSLAEMVDGDWRKLHVDQELDPDDPIITDNPNLFAPTGADQMRQDG